MSRELSKDNPCPDCDGTILHASWCPRWEEDEDDSEPETEEE